MGKRGPPPKEINWQTVANLSGIQCTQDEIEFAIGVSINTLRKRALNETGLKLCDYIKKNSTNGTISLRRWQFKAAEGGSVTMMIWLGKQYLDQSDTRTKESSTVTTRTETQGTDKDEIEQLADWLRGLNEV